ncbi:MAG: hypothetical protein JNK14_04040 [Chitinophagaceae bacterium]|nr:hypothetical protein [Chitinophagaceae bacterium]
MSQGWDPEIKQFFKKILYSVCTGLLWLLTMLTLGLYYGLAYRSDISVIYIILFYLLFVATMVLLMRYLYRLWNR